LIKFKRKHYVNNRDLYKEIVLSNHNGALTEETLNLLIKMTEQIIKNFSYKNPDDIDDIKQTALLKCYLYWNRFNPKKSTNAFSYFTQMIKNGCAEGFNKLHPEKTRNYSCIHLSDIDLSGKIRIS